MRQRKDQKKYAYNPESMMYEPVSEPRWAGVVRSFAFALGCVALSALYFWLYVSVFKFELPKTARLKGQNAEWTAKMEILGRRLDLYDEVLSGLEERDDHVYRSIFGLNEIPDEVKRAGFGGTDRYAWMDEMGCGPDLKEAMVRTDVMTKRAFLQSKSLDEVASVSRTAGDMVSCVPAVPPIIPKKGNYHISSPFGYRVDPVYGGRRFHEGVDFAMDTGNPVYVTGDGLVESARFQFHGYGNEIIIDHGFGYKTRYAHLNTIEVTEGMHLKRGDRIGTVGKTGKSTGPHLHYEVVYKGAQVNPMHYLDMDMSVEEYKAMTKAREEEQPFSKRRPTNAEIFRKRH